MYDEATKNKFLNGGDIDKGEYVKLFQESLKTEGDLSKDLYDFNIEEIQSIFSEQEDFVLLSEYVEWACVQGYKRSNLNLIDMFLIDDEEEEGD